MELQSIEFYEAEFRRRFFSIKSVKTKEHHGVAIKVYIGEHQNYFGFGKSYQEALANVYAQLLAIDRERASLGSTHPIWEK